MVGMVGMIGMIGTFGLIDEWIVCYGRYGMDDWFWLWL